MPQLLLIDKEKAMQLKSSISYWPFSYLASDIDNPFSCKILKEED